MSKRNPTSELNHENWDQEDEKEDAGRFKTATQDVLKGREIRVAKRRAHDSEDKGTGGLFKSFTGFSGFGAPSGAASGAAAAGSNSSLAFNFSSAAAADATPPASTSASSAAKPAPPTVDPNAGHLAQLKALNQSMLRWIQSHVTDNPYCVLTPVFRDYERHLADIERRHPYVESDSSSSTNSTTATTSVAVAANSATPTTANSATPTTANSATPATTAASTESPPKFNFSAAAPSAASSTTTTTTSTPAMPPTFSFNFSSGSGAAGQQQTQQQKPAADGVATTATFFFGASANSSSTSTTTTTTTTTTTASALSAAPLSAKPAFSFSAGPTLSGGLSLFGPGGFAAASAAAASSGGSQDQEDDDYEPPKPETREIREEGAVFSQKCKLFYMAAGEAKQWKEKGVGCVHVKPAEGGNRAQLIVRADNTLGTIMLNTLVTKGMTLTVAKNNLNLACPPNPPMPKSTGDDRKIVPFLVRLKTEADAKELLAKINGLREA